MTDFEYDFARNRPSNTLQMLELRTPSFLLYEACHAHDAYLLQAVVQTSAKPKPTAPA